MKPHVLFITLPQTIILVFIKLHLGMLQLLFNLHRGLGNEKFEVVLGVTTQAEAEVELEVKIGSEVAGDVGVQFNVQNGTR